MSDVSLSKAVRSNLLSLQNTASMMAKTQERLATGNKVNSALDNPTNFFTASSLNSRAGDMGQLLDSMANGIQTLEAADNGLAAITKNLESMQSTLRQARQDKSFQTASFSLDAAAVGTSAVEDLDFSGGAFDSAKSISLHNKSVTGNNGFVGAGGTAAKAGQVTIQATSLNDNVAVTVNFTAGDTAETTAEKINASLDALSDGDGGVSASVVDGQLKLSSSKGEAITIGGTDEEYIGLTAGSVTATTSSVTGGGAVDYTADPDLSALDGESITLTSANGDTTTYSFTNAATGQAAALETALEANGFTIARTANGIDVSRTDGQDFTMEASAAGVSTSLGMASQTVSVTNGQIASGTVTAITAVNEVKTVDQLVAEINSSSDFAGKIRASNDNNKLRLENLSTEQLDIDGISSLGAIDGDSTDAASIGGNSVRGDLAKQYNELRDQLDKLADDASFNGVNLLRGDKLKITFNETGTSDLEIQSKDAKSINAGNLGIETNLEAADLDSDDNIDSLLAEVKTAIGTVRSQSSSFGSSLSIVENRQDFTKSMINTLESGAGNLTLADTNEEAANLLALQTRQQLSSTALSMASQADQAVLRLF